MESIQRVTKVLRPRTFATGAIAYELVLVMALVVVVVVLELLGITDIAAEWLGALEETIATAVRRS